MLAHPLGHQQNRTVEVTMRPYQEKTPGRQTAVGITGVLTFLAVALITQWDVLFPPPPTGKAPPVAHSLLAGKVEPHEAGRQGCSIAPDGVLVVETRGNDTPAECCVRLDAPYELRNRSSLLAVIASDRTLDDFRLAGKDARGESIVLHRNVVYGANNTVNVVIDGREHLGGRETFPLSSFCVSAPPVREQAVIRIKKAEVTAGP